MLERVQVPRHWRKIEVIMFNDLTVNGMSDIFVCSTILVVCNLSNKYHCVPSSVL